jgi:ABC-type bacteriocin/lantibiotic exporter with double-glycine peptidase domain
VSNQSWNVVYQVPGMSQPTPMSCWATSFAMLINYTQGSDISPKDVADKVGRDIEHGDDNATDHQVATAFGLSVDGCTCMNIDGWGTMLTNHGPLYIGINGNTHAILVTGMTSDGTPEGTTFFINDPWDGAVQKSYNTLTEVYESIDNETEFWIVHR